MVRYRYDAWGNLDSVRDENDRVISQSETHIANINPFRYRGYYYDDETGLYYLQSRYYDPEVGRFINGDNANIITYIKASTSGNLYVYCNNNVVSETDSSGLLGISTLLSVLDDVLTIITSIAKNVVVNTKSYKDIGKKLKTTKGRKARRALIKAQENLVIKGTGRGLYRIAKIIGYIVCLAPYIKNLIDWGKERLTFIKFIVNIVVQVISDTLCASADKLLKFIPYIGVIIGFVGSWLLGKLLSMIFTNSKISRMTSYLNKIYLTLNTLPKWISALCRAIFV